MSGTTPYGDVSRAICRRPPVRPQAYRTTTIAEGSMDDSADQLAPQRADKTHETLKAFVAPVAHESDAVTKDPRALVMAQSVYAAFGDYGATGWPSPGIRSLQPAQARGAQRGIRELRGFRPACLHGSTT